MKREDKIKVIARSLKKYGYGLSLQKEENQFLAEKILDDLAAASKRKRAAKAEKADKPSKKKSSRTSKK
jgi:hypothetical protein